MAPKKKKKKGKKKKKEYDLQTFRRTKLIVYYLRLIKFGNKGDDEKELLEQV